MTRMSREFTLVLLGAGLLTAGYFAWQELEPEKRADEQAEERVGGHSGTRGYHGGGFIFIGHSYAGGVGRSPASPGVSRGGFGATGGKVGGGTGS